MRKNDKGRRLVNDSQVRVVERVVERLCAEMIAIANDNFEELGEPLRWSMHGGPGTGKTHVITMLKDELFQNVLGWNIGVEFQIVALQVVMADLLHGDTIHHALAIPIFGRTHTQTTGANKNLTTAKAILQ